MAGVAAILLLFFLSDPFSLFNREYIEIQNVNILEKNKVLKKGRGDTSIEKSDKEGEVTEKSDRGGTVTKKSGRGEAITEKSRSEKGEKVEKLRSEEDEKVEKIPEKSRSEEIGELARSENENITYLKKIIKEENGLLLEEKYNDTFNIIEYIYFKIPKSNYRSLITRLDSTGIYPPFPERTLFSLKKYLRVRINFSNQTNGK